MFVDSCVRPFRQKAGIQQHRLQGAVIVETGQRVHVEHKKETFAPVRLYDLMKSEPGNKEDIARL